MSTFSKQSLLSELMDRTEVITSNTQSFLRLSEEELNYKPVQHEWSISEIYGHLNITNTTYIHSILKKIKAAPDTDYPGYQSGWLGDWVYEKLMPRADGSVYKISSPKFLHAFTKQSDVYDVLNQFLEHQNVTHDILRYASTKNLEQIRIPFYFAKVFTFRLGDTLRFLIAHNERHLLQAHRMMEKIPIVQNG